MSQETKRVLEQAVRDLPPTPRAVILLRDIEGLDAEEVCQQLSLSEANQRVILHRARTAIRLAITKHMQKS
jgi:RNA polymerase sigma-70 factor (ECF subfamily)